MDKFINSYMDKQPWPHTQNDGLWPDHYHFRRWSLRYNWLFPKMSAWCWMIEPEE